MEAEDRILYLNSNGKRPRAVRLGKPMRDALRQIGQALENDTRPDGAEKKAAKERAKAAGQKGVKE